MKDIQKENVMVDLTSYNVDEDWQKRAILGYEALQEWLVDSLDVWQIGIGLNDRLQVAVSAHSSTIVAVEIEDLDLQKFVLTAADMAVVLDDPENELESVLKSNLQAYLSQVEVFVLRFTI